MGWTRPVAGSERASPHTSARGSPHTSARGRLHTAARAMDPAIPALLLSLLLALPVSAFSATSYHRFASGLGMNIRHLPCVSRRTGEAGTCMFAYSCAKLNGTHLGTCIDRFYFGSCCRLPPGVVPETLDQASLDDNFIEDNSISTTEKTKPTTSWKPESTTTLATPTKVSPWTPGPVSSKRPTPGPITTSQRPPSIAPTSTSQRPPSIAPASTSQRPPSIAPVSTSQRPSSATPTYPSPVSTSQGVTLAFVTTTSRPLTVPTNPPPTLVTWTTIDGFPPRKPPSVGSSSVSPTWSTTHRTPVTRPVTDTKPTAIFNTTNSVVTLTSPKPSSPGPSRPSSVTIVSSPPTTARPSSRPTSIRPSTQRPSTQKPYPTRPSTKPTSKPTVPVKFSPKPSVTILTTQRPASQTPTTPGTTSSQRPVQTKPTSVKPTSAKPVVKPTTVKPPRPKPSKPSKPTKPTTEKPTTEKPTTKPFTTRPPTTTEGSTDPDWVQVSVSSHEPSNPTTIFITSESPWTTGRPGGTETTYPVTFTTDQPTTATAQPTVPTNASSPAFPSPLDTNEILNINMSDFRDVCGRRLFPEPRIVGGNKSTFGKWPWQISLRQWRTSTYLHKCGAALLSENWAITAAHCVENVPPSDLLLRLGEYDLSTEEEPYTFQERRVQIVASHPQFDPRTFEYDLALLRFYDPVQFQPNIIPVCVPEDDTNFVGRTAYVTGWGRLYEDGPLPMVLQEVSVPVINNTVCETMYRAAGYIEHIPDIFICAGWKKGGFDSCEGDSGGPMVIERNGDKRWMLAGVISWGIGCAEPNQPGVYTRISHFRHWINQILQF